MDKDILNMENILLDKLKLIKQVKIVTRNHNRGFAYNRNYLDGIGIDGAGGEFIIIPVCLIFRYSKIMKYVKLYHRYLPFMIHVKEYRKHIHLFLFIKN